MSGETTNTIPEPPQRFSLAEMSDHIKDHKKPPVGFFVSKALWNSLSDRLMLEEGLELGRLPVAIHGVKIAVDPEMADTEFDIAFTEEAWTKRASELSNGNG